MVYRPSVTSSWAVAALALMAWGSEGCSLTEASFDASVEVDAVVDGTDAVFRECVTFDPNDSQDFRDNRDRIEEGRIANIRVQITNTGPRQPGPRQHAATYGYGQIDVRPLVVTDQRDPVTNCYIREGAPEWVSIAQWEPVVLYPGEDPFEPIIDNDGVGRLHEWVFDQGQALEVFFDGTADRGPVNFDFKVRFDLEFTAQLL